MIKQRLFSVVMLVVVAFMASMVLTGRMREANEAGAQNRPSTPAPVNVNTPAPVSGGQTLPDFSRIAERTIPSVVNISAQQTVRQDYLSPQDLFFGRRGIRSQRGVSNAIGSGVIVSPDGYVLTNNHVVTGEADQSNLTIEKLDVTVTLSDKRELPAKLIGTDPATDLALLKIQASSLPTMPWGDSSKLKVAEWVLAIGNPYQLSETVTLGIVSAVGRTGLNVSTFEDFIQTDAAINAGNSGGALVNSRGELVGINTAVISMADDQTMPEGLGFAIPVNLVRGVMQQLVAHGRVIRGYLGVGEPIDLPASQATALGIDGPAVLITGASGPAAVAGLRAGDVLTHLNGERMYTRQQAMNLVASSQPGERVDIRVIRANGATFETEAVLEERPPPDVSWPSVN